MEFQPNNKFWEMRSSAGRKPIFESPEHLWECACEYFEWAQGTPLEEEKLFAFQGEVVKDKVQLMRPFTIGALCLFLDIGKNAMSEYGKRPDFVGVVAQIKETIYEQKFSGAAAGLLNSNIIARDLGLKDRTDASVTVTELSQEEWLKTLT